MSKLWLTMVLCLAGAASAASQDSGTRKKVGLVLSGGGARGAAHVGVLEVLEELQIPIDFISGTSMGSIVGGLYAAGWSPAQMREHFNAIDWGRRLIDSPPREKLTFRRKQDDFRFLIDLEIGFSNWSVRLPQGVLQGQNLNLLLREMCLPAAHIVDFDQLPIPFRAVATDIETGEAIVLDSGVLSTALRASMSVPGAFAPVEIGGRRIVDGGVVNNVPIDVAKNMGADVVIVVDIASPLLSKEKLASVFGVSAQILNILMKSTEEKQFALMTDQDFLLRPSLGDLGSGDFNRCEEAIEIGYRDARLATDSLMRYSVSESEFQAFLANQRRASFTPPIIRSVRIVNKSGYSEQVIAERLRSHVGAPFDREKLEEDIATLYGLETFERVDYRLEEVDQGAVLVLEVVERGWGPGYLQFGLLHQNDFRGGSRFNLAIAHTWRPMNALGAEWRNEIQFGDTPGVFSEFYQPLDSGSQYFVAPSLLAAEMDTDVFEEGDVVAEYRVTFGAAQLDVGRRLGNWGEFRAGVRYASGRARPEVGSRDFEKVRFRDGAFVLQLNYDTLDNPSFPTSGGFAALSVDFIREGLGAEDHGEAYEVNLNKAVTFGHHTLTPGLIYEELDSDDFSPARRFSVGGFLNLSGLQINEISGSHAGVVRTIYYYRPGKRDLFDNPLYLGASLEAGNAWEDRDDITFESLILSGSLFVGVDTFLGPIYVGYGLAEGGNQALFLFVGQGF